MPKTISRKQRPKAKSKTKPSANQRESASRFPFLPFVVAIVAAGLVYVLFFRDKGNPGNADAAVTAKNGGSGNAKSGKGPRGPGKESGARPKLPKGWAKPASSAKTSKAMRNPNSPLGLSKRELAKRKADRLGKSLESMRAWYRYPADSRPLRKNSSELLANHVEPLVRPLDPKNKDKKEGERPMIRQKQDRIYVNPGDQVVLTLEAAVGDKLIPIEVSSSEIQLLEGTPPQPGKVIGEAPFKDDGQAPDETLNDLTYHAVAAIPSDLGEFRGEIVVRLRAKAGDEEGEFHYSLIYGGPKPARFTGQFREAMENGSLAIYAAIEVFTGGHYEVKGRVYDKNDAPFAFLNFNGQLTTKQTEVRLLIFGKLVHDESAASPFFIRDVEDLRLLKDTYPDREVMEVWKGPYETGEYETKAFSDEEFASEKKDKDLAALEAMEKKAKAASEGKGEDEEPVPAGSAAPGRRSFVGAVVYALGPSKSPLPRGYCWRRAASTCAAPT